jgi:hypothetical protein
MLSSLVLKYQSLNNSFKKKLVFNLGIDSGFFSEYNNMILAMLYCLDNRISFSLFSKQANFKIDKGWTDYFLSFCEEDLNDNHKRFNYRMPFIRTTKTGKKRHDLIFNHIVNPLKNSFDPFREGLKKIIYFRKSPRFDYFTYNVWNKFRSNEMMTKCYKIPELGIDGDIQEAASLLIKLTWRFNSTTQDRIDKLISSINLPDNYIGFHIRGGDKSKEYKIIEPYNYFQSAVELNTNRKAFVLTDDYGIIEELKIKFPEWDIYTLCGKEERGYSHKEFSNKSLEYKDQNLIKLFSSIEILNRSELFIGTFSSNPGMYMGMRKPKSKCIGLDFGSWIIW